MKTKTNVIVQILFKKIQIPGTCKSKNFLFPRLSQGMPAYANKRQGSVLTSVQRICC